MPFICRDKEELEFFTGILDFEDRVVGLLAPVLIEGRLEYAIKSHFHDLKDGSSTIYAELFRESGPLGAFKTKARMGAALGMYGKDAYSDICNIIKIRNLFAHKINPNTFEHNEIKTLSMNLKLPDLFPMKDLSEISSEILYNWDLAFEQIKMSCVKDVSNPRERFIRANEILSTLIVFTGKVAIHLPDEPQAWIDELFSLKARYKTFLAEKNSSGGYTHRRLRSAFRSLTTNLPSLFLYKEMPEAAIPRTTNHLEGRFAHLREKITLHRGLSCDRKKKAIRFYLYRT